jgi:7-cyano-7-deazaguanine synthase
MNKEPTAVLVSGGLDSAVLLGRLLSDCPAVHPLYVRTGLAWENVELAYLHRFLNALAGPALKPLVIFDLPAGDLYDGHWSVTGHGTPDAAAPDAEFYLPGRNVLLLIKPMLWCHLHKVPAVALAVLAANPFPDATPEFFREFAAAVNRGINGSVRVETPYRGLSKVDIIRLGRGLPLEHTLSCASPINAGHCGVCNKCGERGRAFRAAGLPDPARYQSRAWETMSQEPH